jgi:hypothetical protein
MPVDAAARHVKNAAMDEDALVSQLQQIERELAGGGAVGAEACRVELAEWRIREPDQEFRISVPTPTAQRVLLGWCHRYGLTPYRTARQRKTTMCVRAPRGFMHEVMWPRVEAMAHVIDRATADAARRIVERWSGASLAAHETAAAAAEQGELFSEE